MKKESSSKLKILSNQTIRLREINSTQKYLRELSSSENVKNAVVVADLQTEGKGRLGRKWYSPRGGLYMSILFTPNCSASYVPILALATNVGLALTLNRTYHLSANLRWPNDVMIEAKKIAGILVEGEIKGDRLMKIIIGVGVNLNNLTTGLPPDIAKGAISLREILGKTVKRNEVLKKLLPQLDGLYYQVLTQGRKNVLEQARNLMGTIGKWVSVQVNGRQVEGRATDIGEMGQLMMISRNDLPLTVSYGEVVRATEI